MTPGLYRAAFYTSAALLVLAVANMPWGYYQTLHWLIPCSGVLVIVAAFKTNHRAWIVLGALAIVFFLPVFGVHLNKQVWVLFDLVFAAGFGVAGYSLGKYSSKTSSRKVEG